MHAPTSHGPSIVGALLPADLRNQHDIVRRATVGLASLLGLELIGLARVIQFAMLGRYAHMAVMLPAMLLAAMLPIALRRTGSLVFFGNAEAVLAAAVLTSGAWRSGGFGSPALFVMAMVPLVVLFISGRTSAKVWAALMLEEMLLFRVLLATRFQPAVAAPPHELAMITGIGAALMMVALVGFGLAYESAKDAAIAARISAEAQRADAERRTHVLEAERMRSLTRLATTVAHEANNPLAAVIAGLEFAARAMPRDESDARVREAKQSLADAAAGAERVRFVLDNLMALAPAPADPVRSLSVRSALEAAVSAASKTLRGRITIRCRVDDDEMHVVGSQHRFVQLLLNLILDAAEAFGEDSGHDDTISIAVAPSADGGNVAIDVRYAGAGTKPELLAALQGDFVASAASVGGTGLGWAVCGSIAESLGGTISASCTERSGTHVRLTLPLVKHAAADSERAVRRSKAPRISRHRVLLIDDDPLVLRALSRILRDHDVVTDPRGTDALSRLQRGEKFDAIVCDVMMPDMGGDEVYSRIAALHTDAERRMVFVTGGAFTDRARQFLGSIPNPRLTKPIDPAGLVAALGLVARASSDSTPPG